MPTPNGLRVAALLKQPHNWYPQLILGPTSWFEFGPYSVNLVTTMTKERPVSGGFPMLPLSIPVQETSFKLARQPG